MPTYTIKQASQKKAIPDGKYGPMQVIALTLAEPGSDAETTAEWFTKATTPLPQAGTTIEGEISPGQYGQQFKKAQPAGGFGGGGRGRSPEETKSIVRQHSQAMALQYASIRQAQGELPADKFTLDGLAKLTDWFQRDAEVGWK